VSACPRWTCGARTFNCVRFPGTTTATSERVGRCRWWRWSSSDDHAQDNKLGLLEGRKVCWMFCRLRPRVVKAFAEGKRTRRRKGLGTEERLRGEINARLPLLVFVVKTLRTQSNTNYLCSLSRVVHVCARFNDLCTDVKIQPTKTVHKNCRIQTRYILRSAADKKTLFARKFENVFPNCSLCTVYVRCTWNIILHIV